MLGMGLGELYFSDSFVGGRQQKDWTLTEEEERDFLMFLYSCSSFLQSHSGGFKPLGCLQQLRVMTFGRQSIGHAEALHWIDVGLS